jgi:hypothetical protein
MFNEISGMVIFGTHCMLKIQRVFFNFVDRFMALRFTATGASLAARRLRILLTNQHVA